MSIQTVLIAGRWRESAASGTFTAENPAQGEPLADSVSGEHLGRLRRRARAAPPKPP